MGHEGCQDEILRVMKAFMRLGRVCVQMESSVVVDWVKRNTRRWSSQIERLKTEEFVRKVYLNETVDVNRRGRPLGRWRDRVGEYIHERGANRGGGLEQIKRECLDKERWRLFCHGPTEGSSLPW